MKATDVIKPTAIKYPVAYSGIKNSIPLNPTGSNLASITEGFPEMTMKALAEGGLPPKGQDFNGLFYLATDTKAYLQDGGYISFDSDVSTLIGGYPQGAILDYYDAISNSFSKVVSLIDDNTYNFVTTPSYIDDVKWQFVNFGGANQDLSNLTELGENRLHALKGYLEDGEALVDTTLYNDVHSYANSTFDISKFTITGTPKIVNGVASGLSTSNYITAIPSSMYYNKSNWHLQFKGKFDPAVTCDFMGFVNDQYCYLDYYLDWHSFAMPLYDTSDALIQPTIEQANEKFVKGDVLFDIYYSSTSGYYFTATQNGTTYTSSVIANTNQLRNASTQPLLYIHSTNTISIDLKTIKFFVDNQPVFDGNIIGVDTVYTDNYSVVGTPTISSNGVASGFSATSYLTHTMNFSGSGFKARIPFKVTATNATQELFHNTNLQFRLLYVSASTAVYPSIYLTDGVHTTQPRTSTYKIVANTNYIVEYEFIQGTSVSIKLYAADGVTLLDSLTNTTADTKAVVLPNTNLTTYIGTTNTGTNVFSGSIDLAGTRIETDTEVYRPFLQIPYVLSTTGSKVVDVAYRDRVIDLYEQEGKARYYTIDYTNKNATLPMGEVYGLIESEIVDNPDKVQSANLINVAKTDVVEPSVYKKLEADYHSSFDISKFTKVGSPVITDDGIASGFSSSNYLSIAANTIPLATTTQKHIIKFMITALPTGSDVYAITGSSVNFGDLVFAFNSTAFLIRCRTTNAEANFYDLANATTVSSLGTVTNKEITIEHYWNGTTHSFYWVTDNTKTLLYSANISYPIGQTNAIYLGNHTGWGYNNPYTYIDLKQFSITVDGYPVFNGNKTGLDTIKADDYTVVGTPTITSDGVASGFSSSNYLTQSLTINSSNYKILLDITVPSIGSGQGIIVFDDTNNSRIIVGGSGNLSLYSGTSKIAYDVSSLVGHKISAEFNITSSGMSLDILDKTTNQMYSVHNSNTLQLTATSLTIGKYSSGDAFLGILDLNSIRIYTNGNLVYQPCLKIPYTFAKDGKKIVDGVYDDRVIDVYQQYGSALYTVLDDNNKAYRLPMGSTVGFITDKQSKGAWCFDAPTTVSTASINIPAVVVENYVDGTDQYTLYSDKLLIQRGFIEYGTTPTINIAKTMADTNYIVLSNRVYASGNDVVFTKTTATITPQQNYGGDWMLIGYIA